MQFTWSAWKLKVYSFRGKDTHSWPRRRCQTGILPVTGFTKPIEVYFIDEHIFPKVSTCGLTLTLPLNITCDILSFAVKDRGPFGVDYIWRLHILIKIVHLKFLALQCSSVRNCRGWSLSYSWEKLRSVAFSYYKI